jgi:pimeloyl-ACP methyl ester carboxylesterase
VSSTEAIADGRIVGRRAVWLALQPQPVLAFLYLPDPPADGGRGRTAALLCPAFGWEEMCSYRGRRVWARALARSGYPAATFSLPGSGDSGGSPRDTGQLEAWVASVGQSAEWLVEATGAERVVAIGIGLGGMLALSAVATGAPIDDLVLWGVPARGRAWLRELHAYSELVASRRPEDHLPEIDPEGEHEYIGFFMGADTARELEELRLTELELPNGRARRVLLLGRDGMAPDKRLREQLERSGATVAVDDTDDYSLLMLHPQESEAPQATIAKTLAWLDAGAPAEAPDRLSEAPTRRGPLERAAIELSWNGGTIRETPLSLEGPTGAMFAVLSESTSIERAPLCVVWLNGGALRHIGPNRNWVEAARRWAARGIPTVRVDLVGIGDSEGEEGCVSNPDLYAPRRTQETLSVLHQLAERGLPSRFALGGLCSGAYWSLHAALADPRVAGTLLINLYAFFWSEALVDERETGSALSALRGHGWRRLLHRDLNLGHVRAVASSLRPGRLRSGAGHPVEQGQRAEIERALDKLRDQGTETLLLLSRREGLADQLRRQGVLDRLERWPNLSFETIPSTDHMFRALWLQRHVHAALDRALDRVLAASEVSADR